MFHTLFAGVFSRHLNATRLEISMVLGGSMPQPIANNVVRKPVTVWLKALTPFIFWGKNHVSTTHFPICQITHQLLLSNLFPEMDQYIGGRPMVNQINIYETFTKPDLLLYVILCEVIYKTNRIHCSKLNMYVCNVKDTLQLWPNIWNASKCSDLFSRNTSLYTECYEINFEMPFHATFKVRSLAKSSLFGRDIFKIICVYRKDPS